MQRIAVSSALAFVATTLAGCLNTVTIDARADATTDAAAALDAAMSDVIAPADTVSPRDAGRDAGFPTADDGALAAAERCGEETCAAGERCCLGTGRCFDPVARPDLCPRPAPGGGEGAPCASHSQCAADEFCIAGAGSACFGAGRCQPRYSCGSCGGDNGVCAVCGCDGRTYPNIQTLCLAGIRAAGAGACGAVPSTVTGPDAGPRANPVRIACAYDAQCPGGQSCCPWLGVCVDSTCATCCRPAPTGTDFPCTRDEQCFPSQYCAGEGCGTPGGCTVVRGTGGCSGAVNQVCGCDGRTYINACWATGVGVRVASTGACP